MLLDDALSRGESFLTEPFGERKPVSEKISRGFLGSFPTGAWRSVQKRLDTSSTVQEICPVGNEHSHRHERSSPSSKVKIENLTEPVGSVGELDSSNGR